LPTSVIEECELFSLHFKSDGCKWMKSAFQFNPTDVQEYNIFKLRYKLWKLKKKYI
jgi:hypothetical protein